MWWAGGGGRLGRRLLFRPRFSSALKPSPSPRWAACAAGCSSALNPSPLPRGRGGRRGTALTPALSLAGEGVGGGPPSPRRCPSRVLFRGGGGGGGCAAGCSSALNPGPLPRGRGGRRGTALGPALSLAGEGVGGGGGWAAGCSSALNPSPLPRGRGGKRALGPQAGRPPGCSSALNPGPLPRGEGVGGGGGLTPLALALPPSTPALSLAGEGGRGGGWLLFRPQPQPSPSRERGGDRGGLHPAALSLNPSPRERGSEGVAAGPLVLFRPQPRPSDAGEGG